jgi:hypothetical protein
MSEDVPISRNISRNKKKIIQKKYSKEALDKLPAWIKELLKILEEQKESKELEEL